MPEDSGTSLATEVTVQGTPAGGKSLPGPRLVSLWPLRTNFYHFFQRLQLPFGEISLHWTLSGAWVGWGVTVTVTVGPPPDPGQVGAEWALHSQPCVGQTGRGLPCRGRGRQGPGGPGGVSQRGPGVHRG